VPRTTLHFVCGNQHPFLAKAACRLAYPIRAVKVNESGLTDHAATLCSAGNGVLFGPRSWCSSPATRDWNTAPNGAATQPQSQVGVFFLLLALDIDGGEVMPQEHQHAGGDLGKLDCTYAGRLGP
jgi:hypothetical protein